MPSSGAIQASVQVQTIDLAARSVVIDIGLLSTQGLAFSLRVGYPSPPGDFEPLVDFRSQVSNAVSPSRVAQLRVTTDGTSVTVPVNIRALLETNNPYSSRPADITAERAVHVTAKLPLKTSGMYPLDRYQVAMSQLSLTFPREFQSVTNLFGCPPGNLICQNRTVAFSVSVLTIGELPPSTTWSISSGGVLSGWRPSTLVIYTLVMVLVPLAAALILRYGPMHPSGSSWEVLAALLAILALRSILGPEAGVGGIPTLIDILLALQVAIIISLQFLDSKSVAARSTPPAPSSVPTPELHTPTPAERPGRHRRIALAPVVVWAMVAIRAIRRQRMNR
ncbi:hypothetical protein GCM10009744_64900 [Kribbella alba]|uniref:DUF4436 domain-containing protein n=1 Tax=Kribbella alba TaxID=190197 RepID=A0ABP4RUT3_9ACTN